MKCAMHQQSKNRMSTSSVSGMLVTAMVLVFITIVILIIAYPIAAVPVAVILVILHFTQQTACSRQQPAKTLGMYENVKMYPAQSQARAYPATRFGEAVRPGPSSFPDPPTLSAPSPHHSVVSPHRPTEPVKRAEHPSEVLQGIIESHPTLPVPADSVSSVATGEGPLKPMETQVTMDEYQPESRHDFRAQQARELLKFKQMRKETQPGRHGRLTKAMMDRLEAARRNQERMIANSLRPDPNTIIEFAPGNEPSNNGAPLSDQPFAARTAVHNLGRSARMGASGGGSGNLAAMLQTRI